MVPVPTKPPTDRRWGPVVKAQIFIVSDPTHGRPVQSMVGPTDHRSDVAEGQQPARGKLLLGQLQAVITLSTQGFRWSMTYQIKDN